MIFRVRIWHGRGTRKNIWKGGAAMGQLQSLQASIQLEQLLAFRQTQNVPRSRVSLGLGRSLEQRAGRRVPACLWHCERREGPRACRGIPCRDVAVDREVNSSIRGGMDRVEKVGWWRVVEGGVFFHCTCCFPMSLFRLLSSFLFCCCRGLCFSNCGSCFGCFAPVVCLVSLPFWQDVSGMRVPILIL